MIRNYMVMIEVALHEPLPAFDDEGATTSSEIIAGYCRSLGVAARDGRIASVVEPHVSDGTIDWSESEHREVDIDELDADILERCTPVKGEGVWWKSGRAYYPPDDV